VGQSSRRVGPTILASAGSERLTVAYPQWPPYKILQNGTIGGIDALVLDEIARRTGLEFDYVECPWARCLIMLQNGSVDMITKSVFRSY
jgi:polar amino acid transport system substrate-binding protein